MHDGKRNLPKGWPAIRERVLKRDGHRCTEVLARGSRCVFEGTEVHHIGDRDDHRDENLRAMCPWHHARYTSAQGNAARQRVRQLRRQERHPGLLR